MSKRSDSPIGKLCGHGQNTVRHGNRPRQRGEALRQFSASERASALELLLLSTPSSRFAPIGDSRMTMTQLSSTYETLVTVGYDTPFQSSDYPVNGVQVRSSDYPASPKVLHTEQVIF